MLASNRFFSVLAFALSLAAPAHAADDTSPLTVIIEDGDVLFQGANLDLDQLQARLTASGRQKEKIYFRIGPNAKTVFVQRVIDAIKAAGFADIGMVPPPGMEKALEPPV